MPNDKLKVADCGEGGISSDKLKVADCGEGGICSDKLKVTDCVECDVAHWCGAWSCDSKVLRVCLMGFTCPTDLIIPKLLGVIQ